MGNISVLAFIPTSSPMQVQSLKNAQQTATLSQNDADKRLAIVHEMVLLCYKGIEKRKSAGKKKEKDMSVKILIKRKFRKEALKNAAAMLIKARTNAMGSPGYISTETLVDHDDPRSVLILSMWQSKEAWDAYKDSAARKAHEDKYAELFEGSTEYEIFTMGM